MVRILAGYGPAYFEDHVVPVLATASKAEEKSVEAVVRALDDPLLALRMLYRHYAFARRGKEHHQLADLAVTALRECVQEFGAIALLEKDSGEAMWERYEMNCQQAGRRTHEELNRGVIQGFLELAQEIYRLNPELTVATWVRDAVLARNLVAPVFERVVDIRGVGPKTTSTFIRDMIAIYDLEAEIDPIDRLILQPIDRWVRLIAVHYALDEGGGNAVDWVLAGKMAKLARSVGVSGIDFNMGCTWFGQKQVGDPSKLAGCLSAIEREA